MGPITGSRLPKTGSQLPKSTLLPSDAEFARAIGNALQSELGGSHRAAKTVMSWASVSERTARMWLHGHASPGGLHLIALSAHCEQVMIAVLRLAGHGRVTVALNVLAVETALTEALTAVRELRADAEEP